MCHCAGLPAHRDYYKCLLKLPVGQRKPALRAQLVSEGLIYPAGVKTLYSDIGFMILDWAIETVAGFGLDTFVEKSIYPKLGITDLFFLPKKKPLRVRDRVAPAGAAGEKGVVNDANAAAVGGVCGHAGLFGTARAVYDLILELLRCLYRFEGGRFCSHHIVRQFFRIPPGATRALGFDIPSCQAASCGRYFKKGKTFGHLGYTGTSFWVDLNDGVMLIFLSNRVLTDKDNVMMKDFRPRLHDLFMENLEMR